MAQPNGGPRGLLPDRTTAWENRDGVFLASGDPDCPFIVALPRGSAAARTLHDALVRAGRRTS